MRGDTPKKLQLFSRGHAPCSTGFPCQVSVLGTHLYQCSASVVRSCFWLQWICLKLFQQICPFHDGWFTSTPAHTALSVQQFLTKNCMTPCPTLPIHLISPWKLIFVYPHENILQMETFCWCGRGKQGIKMNEFKNHFEQWKKVSIKCTASNGEHLEV